MYIISFKNLNPNEVNRTQVGIVEQKQSLEAKLDHLALRKHKLECHIATTDNLPLPSLPERLNGKDLAEVERNTPVEFAGKTSTVSRPTSALGPPSGIQSYAPSSPVKEEEYTNHFVERPQTDSIGRARALYDFDAAPGSEEINLKVGDTMEIMEKQDDGWWKVRRNGAVGIVPG